MKDSGPLGPYPDTWSFRRLGEVTQKIGSGATPTGGEKAYLPARERFALIRSQSVHDRRFDLSSLSFISDRQARDLRNAEVRTGDVLLNITGDGVTFARSTLVPEEALPACVNQHVAIIRANPVLLCPGYLLAYLTHPLAKAYIEGFNSGGSRRAVTKGHIESFEIPLPPIEEQEAIAEALAVLDDKIELNRRMNETLEAMAQAIFRDWFVDFGPVRRKLAGSADPVVIMGGLVADPVRAAELAGSQSAALNDEERPVGWSVRPLSELTTELRRGIGPKYVEQGGVLVLNQKCIRNREVSFRPARRHDDAAKSVTGRTLVNGDVLVNSTGVGTLGRVAQIWGLDQRVIVDSHVTVVRASSTDFSSIYLGLALGLREEEIVALGEGSTGQTELSREQLGRMEIVVPSKTVLDQFDAICTPLVERIQANRLEAATLAETRDYLLPRLMSGEVRVRDVAEEIAA